MPGRQFYLTSMGVVYILFSPFCPHLLHFYPSTCMGYFRVGEKYVTNPTLTPYGCRTRSQERYIASYDAFHVSYFRTSFLRRNSPSPPLDTSLFLYSPVKESSLFEWGGLTSTWYVRFCNRVFDRYGWKGSSKKWIQGVDGVDMILRDVSNGIRKLILTSVP